MKLTDTNAIILQLLLRKTLVLSQAGDFLPYPADKLVELGKMGAVWSNSPPLLRRTANFWHTTFMSVFLCTNHDMYVTFSFSEMIHQERGAMKLNDQAISRLRAILNAETFQKTDIKRILQAKEEVLGRYQQLFSPGRLSTLTAEEFQDFLLFKNNKHWNGLHRQGPRMTFDMALLRKALSILVNEESLIVKRLDQLIRQNGEPMVPGLGRAVLTAILLIHSPDRYGVWNGTSEAAMRSHELWPRFERGASFGTRFLQVNEIIVGVAKELGIDLWTLDALWWAVIGTSKAVEGEHAVTNPATENGRFDLEQQLHDYLADHWEKTEIGKEWVIYEEDGDPIGYKYECEAGQIDFLARHKSDPKKWLVVELKKDSTGDQTVGQLLRYMGWVKQNMAGEGGAVHGLIIAGDADKKISYALSQIQNVEFLCYEMNFRLLPLKV